MPILFHAYLKREKLSLKLLKVLEKIYFPVIIIWGSIFTVLVYLEAQDITIYALIVLICGGLFVVKPNFSRLFFITGLVVFSVLIYLNASSVLIANGLIFKAVIVTGIGYLISQANYRIRFELHQKNAQLENINDTLKDQVLRDSLTGLYNNGYVFDYIDNAIDMSIQYGKALSVLMIDIDDFKAINDQYGHLEGDYVIKEVAKIILDETRDFDIAARYGGEEFIVVLNNSDLEQAKKIASRIIGSINKTVYNFEESVTVSIGAAQWDKDNRNDLIKKADDKLYEAKENGKNKVM
jgi:diguanylate cyclase (GGDEF)-like protein